MNYEVVFNAFLGTLALLGCSLLIIFWLVFRDEKTIHRVYRSRVSPARPGTASVQAASAQSDPISEKSNDLSE
jgi:hypothetical protein